MYNYKKSVKMQKRKTNIKRTKQSHRHNWTYFFLILLILAVIIVIINTDFFSGVASVVRGGKGGSGWDSEGSKKLPDLTATVADLQNIDKILVNGTLLINAQVGAGLANIGEAKAIKESVFHVGVNGYSPGVRISVSYLDATGKTIISATTEYKTVYNSYNNAYVDINQDQLPGINGPGINSDAYYVLFSRLPINMPPTDGTVSETKFTFYSLADASLVISESNENNNYKEDSYIFRCAYLDDSYYPNNNYPNCCVHRVDPLSTTYTNIRGDYCEDYPPYHVLYAPA